MKEKPIVALIYDFDNTLAKHDMQNFTFIPGLGMTPSEFWHLTDEEFKKQDMDKILCYMYIMLRECKKRGILLTREFLNSCGKGIEYFDGVLTWFDRINKIGELNGVKVEHYIVSCGNLEILEGCEIFDKFTKCFACEFIYNEKGNARWPKTAINFTGKTQYIFRINKGLLDDNDDKKINEKQKDKRVLTQNMIYIGDGLTDVPAMITVREQGGNSIAVYRKGDREKVSSYYEDERVNYICEADYTKGSILEQIVTMIIKQAALKDKLEKVVKKTLND